MISRATAKKWVPLIEMEVQLTSLDANIIHF